MIRGDFIHHRRRIASFYRPFLRLPCQTHGQSQRSLHFPSQSHAPHTKISRQFARQFARILRFAPHRQFHRKIPAVPTRIENTLRIAGNRRKRQIVAEFQNHPIISLQSEHKNTILFPPRSEHYSIRRHSLHQWAYPRGNPKSQLQMKRRRLPRRQSRTAGFLHQHGELVLRFHV